MSPPSPSDTPSPMMQQWHACKAQAKGALLLFRLGDFYEAFYEDAALLAQQLELTLTQRQGIPMSGVPVHAISPYIDKLVSRGYRVAIAEQTEDPKQVKGIVKREIVRIVTPGTVIDSSLLSAKHNNYLLCICASPTSYGLARLDLTTAEFKASELDTFQEVLDELYRIEPAECLLSQSCYQQHKQSFETCRQQKGWSLQTLAAWHFHPQLCRELLLDHFNVHTLDGFGLREKSTAIQAAAALLRYLHEELHQDIGHIQQLSSELLTEYMAIDSITQHHLKILHKKEERAKPISLLALLDATSTAMGGRLLGRWVQRPLLNIEQIEQRQESIAQLLAQPQTAEALHKELSQIRDLERLLTRLTTSFGTPRDLLALGTSLQRLPQLATLLQQFSSPLLTLPNSYSQLLPLSQQILQAISPEPPLRISDGGTFRKGYHQELDKLKDSQTASQQFLANYQSQLRQELGIKTLRVSYNRAFGYYIEVSRAQATNMPASFQRRQTLVHSERFLSPELRQHEHAILSAEERLLALEQELFDKLKASVQNNARELLEISTALATVDCLLSLAIIARKQRYTRPTLDMSDRLEIDKGRHPLLEILSHRQHFIANDTHLNASDCQLMLITGPNMAGKSTYIRQVALISVMAQIGSYVPAQSAHLGLIDKVFSRIGASDDLSRGQSTFMVEMAETANILHHLTPRSLVILDEIGRGTSTYDGIAIAWSVVEYLLTHPQKQAKTLFATHYWELNKLATLYQSVKNFNVAVSETEQQIVFRHQIVPGGTDKSYGIHVAKLAGLPTVVIERAKKMLEEMEQQPAAPQAVQPAPPPPTAPPLLQWLEDLDPEQMTPLEALSTLIRWKKALATT